MVNALEAIKDFGCITSIEVIKKYVSLSGKLVVDAGCGDMTFTRPLVEAGARALAIDPDPIQAERNRAAEPIANLEFVESSAENIPQNDNSIDGIFFSYSLHHIPAELYPKVFAEVFRVLKRDGFLFVIEPADCPLNQVMKLFHDEDKERAAAQQALVDLAVPKFNIAEQFTYHSFSNYESFEKFADHFSSRTFNNIYTETDVRRDEVREAFERHGRPDYRFQSAKLTWFFQQQKEAQ